MFLKRRYFSTWIENLYALKIGVNFEKCIHPGNKITNDYHMLSGSVKGLDTEIYTLIPLGTN
jgi:hypothetical protein